MCIICGWRYRYNPIADKPSGGSLGCSDGSGPTGPATAACANPLSVVRLAPGPPDSPTITIADRPPSNYTQPASAFDSFQHTLHYDWAAVPPARDNGQAVIGYEFSYFEYAGGATWPGSGVTSIFIGNDGTILPYATSCATMYNATMPQPSSVSDLPSFNYTLTGLKAITS
jgi:hypothetical protein